jgi:hypothetical protein
MLQSRKRASDTDAEEDRPRRTVSGAMKRFFLIAVLFTLVAVAPSLKGSQRVAIRVSPAVAMEPALLTIRATVEPNDENRKLSLTLESEGYATSSDIPLEGRNSARLNVVEIRDVPSGLYEVRAVLSGPSGPLASTVQVVKIQPAPGGRSR